MANPPVMMPPIKKRPLRLYLLAADESIGTLLAQNNEWGKEQEPSANVDKRIQLLAPYYILIDKDLYRKNKEDGLLLRCLGRNKSMRVMAELYLGIYGAHQEHGPVQRVPAINMQPVVKIWPFRRWALDFIGKLTPSSADGHTYIMVATDYFTKWAEAIPLKTFLDYCAECGVQVISSIPYLAQSNGQAKASNKAYRNSKRSNTGVTPYMLTYGHNVVPLIEMTIRSARVAFQNKLTPADYDHAMLVELEDLDEVRLNALDHIIAQKRKVMRAYNKKVKANTFVKGDLVWQVRFPPGVKNKEYRKWTPNWKGPYLVERVPGKKGL
ncbi:uncharacterized protein LOC132309757 [Cornus florida]|uniref:uncharacterized protein LOC132309757 n=1 Tax=Cornus florida TaxID=4283 RepID=UPI00289B56B5|nr:uncharacterized protein LOC132309757 [Cornus florida]